MICLMKRNEKMLKKNEIEKMKKNERKRWKNNSYMLWNEMKGSNKDKYVTFVLKIKRKIKIKNKVTSVI